MASVPVPTPELPWNERLKDFVSSGYSSANDGFNTASATIDQADRVLSSKEMIESSLWWLLTYMAFVGLVGGSIFSIVIFMTYKVLDQFSAGVFITIGIFYLLLFVLAVAMVAKAAFGRRSYLNGDKAFIKYMAAYINDELEHPRSAAKKN